MKKCIVLFSGGLDSRLAIKIMREQSFDIFALYFKLPFSQDISNDIINFCKKEKCKLKIIDYTEGKLLKEYLQLIKKPKYGYGVGCNPCIDCHIFMLKKAKALADKLKIDLIVTGEVLNERPMSQYKKALILIENASGLSKRLLRPLSAKLLDETNAERNCVVNRESLYGLQGRRRNNQIVLADYFKINYPEPAGGCLLCDRSYKCRFQHIFKRGITAGEVKFIKGFRHFLIDGSWVILGKNENENSILENNKHGRLVSIEVKSSPIALVLDKFNKSVEAKVIKLIKAYSKGGSQEERKSFDLWKI